MSQWHNGPFFDCPPEVTTPLSDTRQHMVATMLMRIIRGVSSLSMRLGVAHKSVPGMYGIEAGGPEDENPPSASDQHVRCRKSRSQHLSNLAVHRYEYAGE